MKIIKHINNNFAVAKDSVGNTIIVQGKGIGFGDLPREVNNFEGVARTYYDIDEIYIDMIKEIPIEIIALSGKIIDRFTDEVECALSPNIVFTLADHICFGIERNKKNINMTSPILNDVKYLHEKEYSVGLYALDLIEKELHEALPIEEAALIALHIVISEQPSADKDVSNDVIFSDIINLIESKCDFKINTNSFYYSRFASHLNHFLNRIKYKQILKSKNEKIFESAKIEYTQAFDCVEAIADYFATTLQVVLSNEEKLYLILHINKLCNRE